LTPSANVPYGGRAEFTLVNILIYNETALWRKWMLLEQRRLKTIGGVIIPVVAVKFPE
jgi:hypothetical protein